MDLSFKIGEQKYSGTATAIEKEKEFEYAVDIGGNLQFTIHLDDNGYWKSDHFGIDPELVMHAGEAIENMEDLSDVLTGLDSLKQETR